MPKRIDFIDGLRGIAAVLVVLHHFSLAFYPATYTGAPAEVHTGNALELWVYRTPLNLLINGNFAVVFFLVVSGFSLSVNYFQTHNPAGLSGTAAKRYFRLLPPIVVSNLAAWLILVLGLNYNFLAATISRSTWWLSQNWLVTPNFWLMLKQSFFDVFLVTVPATEAYNSSLWIIPAFFIGTYIVLSLLALFGTSRLRPLVYILLIYLFRNTFYYPLIVGVWICDLAVHYESRLTRRWGLLSLLLLLSGIYLGSYPTFQNRDLLAGSIYAWLPDIKVMDKVMLYHVVGSGLILAGLFMSKRMQTWLSHPWFLFLGKISYSLYVSHVVILLSWGCYWFIRLSTYFPYSLASLMMFCLTFPVMLLAAFYIYRFIEKPAHQHVNSVL